MCLPVSTPVGVDLFDCCFRILCCTFASLQWHLFTVSKTKAALILACTLTQAGGAPQAYGKESTKGQATYGGNTMCKHERQTCPHAHHYFLERQQRLLNRSMFPVLWCMARRNNCPLYFLMMPGFHHLPNLDLQLRVVRQLELNLELASC